MQTHDLSNFFRTETDLANDQARQKKAQRTKDLGDPLELPGKILSLNIRGSEAWTAESDHVARRLSLESGKTIQIYKGHTGPVTCLAIHEPNTLFTGSWDKTIKSWSIMDRSLQSTTPAHSDFVKTLLVIPSLSLLVSGSSDKVVRFWDILSDPGQPLVQIGSISAHTRPVEALAFETKSEKNGMLYTADTMGVLKVWEVERVYGEASFCLVTLRTELQCHRTGINELWAGKGFLWSASNDHSVVIQPFPPTSSIENKATSKTHKLSHPSTVRAILPVALTNLGEPYLISASGDVIRTYAYDVTASDDPPELLSEIDAHWHEVTALGLWMRAVEKDGKKHIETWILSASLDGTLRRWQLKDLLNPNTSKIMNPPEVKPPEVSSRAVLTEEEERELEELMQDD